MIKDEVTRDRLCKKLDVICFEMKVAGLMSNFFSLMIRGICDYFDSHKNEKWQRYAFALTIDFVKELLELISTDRVRQEKSIIQISNEKYIYF